MKSFISWQIIIFFCFRSEKDYGIITKETENCCFLNDVQLFNININKSIILFILLQKPDLNEAMKSLRWNRRLMKYLGIWPLEIYDPLFLICFIYLFIHCSLTFANLIDYENRNDLAEIVVNLTENVLFGMTLTKITICRMHRKSLGQLLVEIENNFVVNDYNTLEKKFIFMKYTKLAKYYVLIAFTSMTIALGLYYINGMIPNIKIGNR